MVHLLRQYNLPRKRSFSPTPFPHIPMGGRLAHFLNQWQLITSDKFQNRTPLSSVPLNMSVTRDPDRNLLLQEEVHTLLHKRAVESVVNPPITPCF